MSTNKRTRLYTEEIRKDWAKAMPKPGDAKEYANYQTTEATFLVISMACRNQLVTSLLIVSGLIFFLSFQV